MAKDLKQMGIPIPIRITVEQLEFVDALAAEFGTSRNRIMINLWESGYEDARLLTATGIIPTVMKLKKLRDRFWQDLAGSDATEEVLS